MSWIVATESDRKLGPPCVEAFVGGHRVLGETSATDDKPPVVVGSGLIHNSVALIRARSTRVKKGVAVSNFSTTEAEG